MCDGGHQQLVHPSHDIELGEEKKTRREAKANRRYIYIYINPGVFLVRQQPCDAAHLGLAWAGDVALKVADVAEAGVGLLVG